MKRVLQSLNGLPIWWAIRILEDFKKGKKC
jgi:hypothetical protein